MTVWELLATTEHRVIAWQDCPWPSLGDDCRVIYWRDSQDQHTATAIVSAEEVICLELVGEPEQRWCDPRYRDRLYGDLTAQGLDPTRARGLGHQEALRQFLGRTQ